MANAKKKPSVKPAAKNVKYAAKAQSAARATSPAQPSAANWVSGSTEQWQKGASDWAKQSAKLYQLPFAQGDVNAATKQAADTVKSATENMVKMSSDMMQKMFGEQAKASSSAPSFDPAAMFKQFQTQAPQLDMGAAGEKFSKFAEASTEQLNKASQSANRAGAEAMEISRETVAAMTEALNIIASVSKELAAEMVSYMNKQFSQNVELSKQVMTCRTLNDLFDLSTRITKANLDAFFSQSVKTSETIFACANDVSEPLNACAAKSSARLSKAMTA